MSISDAIVTGIVFACFSTIQNYILNRILIRPLDKKWDAMERWVKSKMPSNGK